MQFGEEIFCARMLAGAFGAHDPAIECNILAIEDLWRCRSGFSLRSGLSLKSGFSLIRCRWTRGETGLGQPGNGRFSRRTATEDRYQQKCPDAARVYDARSFDKARKA